MTTITNQALPLPAAAQNITKEPVVTSLKGRIFFASVALGTVAAAYFAGLNTQETPTLFIAGFFNAAAGIVSATLISKNPRRSGGLALLGNALTFLAGSYVGIYS